MKTKEYLEDLVKGSFEHEMEVDENVARTLPFFAATLALAATLFSVVLRAMPPPAWRGLSLVPGKLLPDVDVPVSAWPKVVGPGLLVAATALAIALWERGSDHAWLVVAMAACAANRLKAGGVDIATR